MMDPVHDILEEIALEGLDGITVEALWTRLLDRPNFFFADRLDNETKEFIWNIVRQMRDVEFYVLPEPRKPLVLFSDRYIVEAELGLISEISPPPEDIYPHEVVQDLENNILGSCTTYKTRKKVTDIVRKINLNLANSVFGSSLVLVANQETRRRALIGTHSNPNMDIGGPQYCMLERIGRSRYCGEPTQGRSGLQSLKEDPKTIFYYRKVLLKNNLITKQVFQLKLSGNNVSGLLLHLTRFYKLVKPKFVTLTENVVKYLKEQPNGMVDYNILRDHLVIPGVLRRLTKVGDFQKFVRTDVKVPYRMLHPDADIKQWKQKATDKEKRVRVVQLRDVNVDIRDVQKQLLGSVDDEDDDDEKSEGILNEKSRFLDVPLLTQCCIIIKNTGNSGVTQSMIAKHLGLTRVQRRTICKNLVKTGAVGSFMADVGRQRVSKFYLKHIGDKSNCMETYIEGKVTELVNTAEDFKAALENDNNLNIVDSTNDNIILESCLNENQSTVCTRVLKNEFMAQKENDAVPSTSSSVDESEISRVISFSPDSSNIEEISYFKDSTFDETRNSLEPIIDEDSSCTNANPSVIDNTEIGIINLNNNVVENENSSQVSDDISSEPLSNKRSGSDLDLPVQNKRPRLESNDVDKDNNEVCESSIQLPRVDDITNSETTELHKNLVSNVIENNREAIADTNIENKSKQSDIKEHTKKTKTVKSKNNDVNLDKVVNVDVEISDDFQWLLPEDQYKKEIIRLRQNDQIACKSLKTYRLLKRCNIIMEAVHENTVINDIRKLVLVINEAEYREGESCRMDKKSLLRILFRLALDKHIKIYRATLKSDANVKYVDFICSKKVTPDHPTIKSSIEFARLKFQSSLVNLITDSSLSPSNNKGLLKHIIDVDAKKMAVYYPKFNRMKVIHRFLFYLVYCYEGCENQDQELAKMNLRKECDLTEDVVNLMSFVFYPKADWKMFVPPLPKYAKEGNGWCLFSDILIRLPLSLFTQLVHVPHYCPDIDKFLNHPIKKHVLVAKLPPKMRNCLTAGRKYIFTIFEAMARLAYVGLLQFGPHLNKEKEQVFSYVNRNATLLDTTLSKPGYNKISPDIDYPVRNYKFNTLIDVEEYWINAMNICMNTRLGGRCHILGTDLVLENIQDKQEMINALKPRDFSEAAEHDTGYLPGDKLGAAGYDSALFAHLKRNWHSKPVKGFAKKKAVQKHTTASSSQVDNLLKSNPDEASVEHQQRAISNFMKRKRTASSSSTSSLPRKISIIKQTRVKPVKSIKVRHINPKKSLIRRPYYDQVDKEALKRMSKLRVDWSQEEDRILLICKIASAFICPDTRKQINAHMFLAFREVLHKTIHFSKNKTSRACQRRVAYMLRSPNTTHNVNLCIEELRQDEEIMKKYGGTLEYIQNEATLKGKKIKDMESLWKKRFKELVFHLMGRYNYNFSNLSFNMNNKLNENFILPDNLDEFHELYNLLSLEKNNFKFKGTFKSINNVTDIYSAVLNVTIHSTLCCNSDKTAWSYHLFSIYQQYPEKLLRSVLCKLRSDHMVSFKKSYQANRLYSTSYLPLSASPYQLSITYVNLMQTKYQTDLFFESYEFFQELVNGLKKNKKNRSKGFPVLSLNGGTTASVVQLFSNDVIQFMIDIPDQIIILDPNVKSKDENYARLVQRYQDILSNYKKDLTSSVLFQKNNYAAADDDDDELDNIKNENDKCNDSSAGDYKTRKPTALQNVVAKAASRIALYLMRDDLKSTSGMVPKELDHAHDFFVVNSCNIFVKFKKPLNQVKIDSIDEELLDNEQMKGVVEKVRLSAIFDDTLSHSLRENEKDLNEILIENFSTDEIDLVRLILQKMESKKELGLTNAELIDDLGNEFKIVLILKKLKNLNLILYTGVIFSRYVHYLFVRPWLLHSYRSVRVEKDSRLPLKGKQCVSMTDTSESCSFERCQDDNGNTNWGFFEPSFSQDSGSINNVDKPSTSSENDVICAETSPDQEMGNVMTPLSDNKTTDNYWGIQDDDYKKLIKHNMSHPIKVIMRPWIRVDGTLNHKVLDMILTSILSHIMLHPGVSLLNLQYRFSPAFLPHHTREVCDILVKLKCVKMYSVKAFQKPSLFSEPCPIVIIDQPTGLEPEKEVRYEATKYAILNLGKLIDNKSYKQDLIKCLLGR